MEENIVPPLIGQTAPDFLLGVYHEDQEKKARISDYRGKWLILFFYPADFTFVCPTELEAMAILYPEFQKLGAEVMSVSTDTVFVHKAWHDHSETIKKINFPMAADATGALCKALGTYIPTVGLSLRASFIIDPDGVIRAFEMHDTNIGRNANELLRKLQAAIFVREHGTEVCPANWHPGEKTLTPSLEMVGKI